ncbi:MAG: GntR family transcriptional regulator [Peptococcaceae bacterium]|nr:GntR family transcriptional regulator [Peptococcaceae bacterium]
MILIDYKSRTPIYEQIIENVKTLIVSGVLERDQQLPSVRQLAQELAINPNTIQRAYQELEREGIIYSLKGRGSFVGSSLGELRTVQQAELLAQLEAVSRELKQLEVGKEQILAVVAQVYGTEKEDTQHDHV